MSHAEHSRKRFEAMYGAPPPWDIGRAQCAVVEAEAASMLDGSVLDIGCGTGDNSIFLAAAGHRVVGVDCVPSAIQRAIANDASRETGDVQFLVADVLSPDARFSGFDHVLDTGLFHHLTQEQRLQLADVLANAIRAAGTYVMLGFAESAYSDAGSRTVLSRIRTSVSTRHDPSPQRPPSVNVAQLVEAFSGSAWQSVGVEPARYETRFGDVPAWLAVVKRSGPLEPSAES